MVISQDSYGDKFRVGFSGGYSLVWNFLFNRVKSQIIQVLLLPK